MANENKITKRLLIKCNKLKPIKKLKNIDPYIFCDDSMVLFKNDENKDYSIIWNCKICSRFMLNEDSAKNHIMSHTKMAIENKNTKRLVINCIKLDPIEKIKIIDQQLFCPDTMVIYENYENKDYSLIWNCKECSKYLLNEDSAKNHVKSHTKMAIENKNTKRLVINCIKLYPIEKIKIIDQQLFCPDTMAIYENYENKDYSLVWNCKECSKYLLNEDSAKNHFKSHTKMTIENKNTNRLVINCNKLDPIEKLKNIDQQLFCPDTMVIYENYENKDYSLIWNCIMCSRYILNEDLAKNHIVLCANELLNKEHLILESKIIDFNKSKAAKKKINTCIDSECLNETYLYKKFKQCLNQ